MPQSLIPVIVIVVLVLLLLIFLKRMWRVAEPNEALIISGFRERGPEGTEESLGFRVVSGKGTLVMPGVQMVRTLSLDLRKADLQVDCVTTQGIPVHVRGVVIFKIGDDFASIANAARRFLGQEDTMEDRVHNVFAGHLRSIVGGMTVESMIRDRQALTEQTRSASGTEMEKLGLIIDSLQIQEIDDPTGYIENLAKPHIAQVQKDARIAEAENDQAAAEREAQAAALKAEAQRESNVKQAGYTAEVQQAEAEAAQSGPLASAKARQDVVREETQVAQLEAERRERQLDAEVRKPADADNYKRIKEAEASRQATILEAEAESERVRKVGEAEGDAIKAKGQAEGEAIKARAEGLATNQEAVIAQQLAEHWPEIVQAAAAAFSDIDSLTVLNGAEGVTQALASIISQGGAGLDALRQALTTRSGSPSGAAVTDGGAPSPTGSEVSHA